MKRQPQSFLQEVKQMAERYSQDYPEWRAGQCAWNALDYQAPIDTRYIAARTLIHGTSADPFNDDRRLELFWEVIECISLLSAHIEASP